MRKLGKIIVACAAIAFMAAPAYAIQADFTGFFQARAFTYNNLNGNDDVDDNARGVDQRFRVWTNAALSENVKSVFAIEIDNIWGEGVGKVGADEKGQIEIKQVYLDFNVPSYNTNVKAGTHYERLGGGFIKSNDAAGLSVRYTPVKDMSFLLSWTKMRENRVGTLPPEGAGGVFDHRGDADYYHVQYDGNFSGWKVSPFIGYMYGAPTGLGLSGFSDKFEAWYLGTQASGKIGPVGFSATAVVNTWDNDVDVAGTTIDNGMGIALWAKGTYAMGPTTFTAEGAYYGDDDAGQFISVRGYNNFSEMVSGGRFDRRGEMGGNSTLTPSNASYYLNYLYAKLGAAHKLNDSQTVSAFYVYSQEAASGFNLPKIKFGHELNGYYDHAITKGLTWSVGGGYLIADERRVGTIIVDADNSWKVGTAITYRF